VDYNDPKASEKIKEWAASKGEIPYGLDDVVQGGRSIRCRVMIRSHIPVFSTDSAKTTAKAFGSKGGKLITLSRSL
jgi:hypothetical protein